MLIPNQIQVETVRGICTARCIMCPIDGWNLEPMFMSLESYGAILDKIAVHKDRIRFLTLQGFGEPLLDKTLCEKIRMSRERLLPATSVGFSSNCSELTPELSERLIDSGLSVLICSIDGIQKETHESIRIGLNYDEVVENVKTFIRLRQDKTRQDKTRLIIRFVRQECNYDQWDEYREYWTRFIDPAMGDQVVKFDVHNWGGEIKDFKEVDAIQEPRGPLTCVDLYERFVVQCDGTVGLCCTLGDQKHDLNLGNLFESGLAEIYNNDVFNHYRKKMSEGRICDLETCRNCTLPVSRYKKDY